MIRSNKTSHHESTDHSTAEIDQGNTFEDHFKIPSSNNSGFNEIYSQFHSLRTVLTSQVQGWKDHIRPLSTFLGLTNGSTFRFSPNAYTPPTTHFDKNFREKVGLRVRLNFAFFVSNYALILCVVGVVVSLMHPIMIAWVCTVYLLWKIHLVLVESRMPLTVMGYDLGIFITSEIRSFILYGVTLVVIIIYCLVPLLCCFGISASIILSHSVMRDIHHIEKWDSSGKYQFDEESSSKEEKEVGEKTET